MEDRNQEPSAGRSDGPRVALVHDWLNTKRGGAEYVLEVLADMFPQAPIYTLVYNPSKFHYAPERIHISYLQKMPDMLKQRNRYLLPLIPSAIESWDFSAYDVVISSSSAFAKNIVTPETTRHICYCHTPMRFVWDYWPRYLSQQRVGPLRRAYITRQTGKMRMWDFVGAQRVDRFLANSRTTQQRIHKFYRRKADVIFPPVDTSSLVYTAPAGKRDYYVTLAALTPYKKIDAAIEAFNVSGKKLTVIGDGPDRNRLQELAGDNIEFTGYISAKNKARMLTEAKGLLFPNVEDFGIAPVEAMASGTPVIAYNAGGARETVLEGETGIFFDQQTPAGINQAIERLESSRFNGSTLTSRAQQFSTATFTTAIQSRLDEAFHRL
jgi:glycosyltransferase involved in cell wall biosynthesis